MRRHSWLHYCSAISTTGCATRPSSRSKYWRVVDLDTRQLCEPHVKGGPRVEGPHYLVRADRSRIVAKACLLPVKVPVKPCKICARVVNYCVSHPTSKTPSRALRSTRRTLRQDVLHALRRCAVAGVHAKTLGDFGSGIGATTAVFSLIRSMMLKSLLYQEPLVEGITVSYREDREVPKAM